MKRCSMLLLAILMAVTFTACSQGTPGLNGDNVNKSEDVKKAVLDNTEESVSVLAAKVMDVDGSSVLLANMAEDAGVGDIYLINTSSADVADKDGNPRDTDSLKPGMLVDVAYDGTIQESYPMGLGGVSRIILKEQGDDIAGLYRTVVDDLYEVDPGLNDNAEIFAFDLTSVSNITEAEKAALIYMIGNDYRVQSMAATFDELSEQGYIDKDKKYFEKGLLFIIEDNAVSGDSFTFDAQKWRSGLGAYFFVDYTASKTSQGWSYTIGSEMIS